MRPVEPDNNDLPSSLMYADFRSHITVGLDYMSPTLSALTFISGQTVGAQRCTVISALDDSLIETEEVLNVSMTASPTDGDAVRFTAGQGVATVTILQDPNDSMFI